MHVAARPIMEPVALVEKWHTLDGERQCLRVLVFRTGLLPGYALSLLGKLVAHI